MPEDALCVIDVVRGAQDRCSLTQTRKAG